MELFFKIDDQIVKGKFIFSVNSISDVAGLRLDKHIMGFSNFILIYVLDDGTLDIDPVLKELYPETAVLIVNALQNYLSTPTVALNESINLCS